MRPRRLLPSPASPQGSEKNRFGLLYEFFRWIGVVAVALPPPVYYGGNEKICPDCAENVLVDANVCRFCEHRVAAQDAD